MVALSDVSNNSFFANARWSVEARTFSVFNEPGRSGALIEVNWLVDGDDVEIISYQYVVVFDP